MAGDVGSVAQECTAACSVCGRASQFCELPGHQERLCLSCSADLATVVVLRTEIDAATLAGQNTENLVMEFAEFSARILMRAQSADVLENW